MTNGQYSPTPQTTVCVAAVVKLDDRVLLVRQAAGHSLAGQWTVPWGRVDAGESPAAAALRETMEEGGVAVVVEGLLGVQELPAPWTGWIALAYLCRHVSGVPQPDDRETDDARYFSSDGLAALDEPLEPWSAWIVRRVFAGDLTLIREHRTNPLQWPGAFL